MSNKSKGIDKNLEQLIEADDRPVTLAGSKSKKSIKTRQTIIETAIDLVRECGSVEFQMAEVARRCGMSKGSLYYYFRDREDLVDEIFSISAEAFVARLRAIVDEASDPIEALHGMCHEFFESIYQGGAVLISFVTEMTSPRNDALMEAESRFTQVAVIQAEVIEQAKAQGLVRADVDSTLASANISGAFLVASIQRINGHGPDLTSAEFTDRLVAFLLNGIGTQAARDALVVSKS